MSSAMKPERKNENPIFLKITEVGPRDGLQNEPIPIPTPTKWKFIEALKNAGIQNIEVTSFVRKDRIPQLADSDELSRLLDLDNPNIHYSCLTPNLHGYSKAVELGYKEVAVFTAASNSFSQKNINKTIPESLEAFREIFRLSRKDGIKVRGYVSTVIACPYEGWIRPDSVLEVVDRLLEEGVYEISLGETIGKATPAQVESLLEVLFKKHMPSRFAVHFHDTYGMAIANVQKAMDMGITSFDSSAGGLGGCPYAKGAAGNLATEDLVYLLESEGYSTGVDLDLLTKASSLIENFLGKPLPSKTYQALRKSKE